MNFAFRFGDGENARLFLITNSQGNFDA